MAYSPFSPITWQHVAAVLDKPERTAQRELQTMRAAAGVDKKKPFTVKHLAAHLDAAVGDVLGWLHNRQLPAGARLACL